VRLDVRKIIPSGGDLALVIVEWTEWTTGETKHWAATATDIVRKQPDGTWKLALDIPYGIETAHGSYPSIASIALSVDVAVASSRSSINRPAM
jgi:hypothetical protein